MTLRTTTDEEWTAAIEDLAVRFPAAMSAIVQRLGPVPMPNENTEQWKIDDALETLERICNNPAVLGVYEGEGDG